MHVPYYANELLAIVRVRFSFQKLLQIVVKFNITLFYRYFYNHLSNYTKTIIRLRLVNINLLLTEREGRTGEYWPEVVAVRTECSEVRSKTTEGQYSTVRLEQARLLSGLLYGTLSLSEMDCHK